MDAALPAPEDARLAALLARWQEQHDVDALDELLRSEVEGLARRLRMRAGGALSASTSASDLVQEAVLRCLRLETPPRFDDVRGLRGYLWTAAWRLLANRVQRPERDVVRLSQDDSMALSGAFAVSGGLSTLAADEQRTALEVVVNLLRPEDRECLGLVYFQGLSIDEAARRAGVSRGAFDMRLMRARQRLAERLVDWADVVG
jgi:RNA polymerase sigma-70 factor (ECF subfamily)